MGPRRSGTSCARCMSSDTAESYIEAGDRQMARADALPWWAFSRRRRERRRARGSYSFAKHMVRMSERADLLGGG